MNLSKGKRVAHHGYVYTAMEVAREERAPQIRQLKWAHQPNTVLNMWEPISANSLRLSAHIEVSSFREAKNDNQYHTEQKKNKKFQEH
eukprot:309468-Amphidinium_carterae.1